MFASVPSVIQHVRAAKLNALAVTSAQRSPAAPELPTVSEQGLPGYEVVSWFGIVAPTGTPADIVRRLNDDVRRVLVLPEFQERLRDEGGRAFAMTPEEFTAFIRSETVRWGRVVRDVGAKLD
jgi:tripartite-type tricarboxylate transporter receptor subunit TctC